jgi:hypothetical protein
VYVDTSVVREGALEQLKAGMGEKARLLGRGAEVEIGVSHAGFSRFTAR